MTVKNTGRIMNKQINTISDITAFPIFEILLRHFYTRQNNKQVD